MPPNKSFEAGPLKPDTIPNASAAPPWQLAIREANLYELFVMFPGSD